ncbi:MAG: DUF3253 domain-containing protein [Pseudomonadota bacterium]
MSTSHDEKTEDPLVAYILERAAEADAPTPADIARGFAIGRVKPKDGPDAWRRYLNPVKQQILHLARQGRIDVLRNGEKVDPKDARGVTRIRLADTI